MPTIIIVLNETTPVNAYMETYCNHKQITCEARNIECIGSAKIDGEILEEWCASFSIPIDDVKNNYYTLFFYRNALFHNSTWIQCEIEQNGKYYRPFADLYLDKNDFNIKLYRNR